jgi:hypothetical protein
MNLDRGVVVFRVCPAVLAERLAAPRTDAEYREYYKRRGEALAARERELAALPRHDQVKRPCAGCEARS